MIFMHKLIKNKWWIRVQKHANMQKDIYKKNKKNIYEEE
jgi:hypothetical protein